MIGIVGAGIGGLALGHFLREAGIDHVVLEAEDRVGGVIRSTRDGSRVLDHGPQRTRVTPGVDALIRAARLEPDVVSVPPGTPLYVFRDGRLRTVPFSFADFARTDLLSVGGKLRVLLEPATSPPRLGKENGAGTRVRRLRPGGPGGAAGANGPHAPPLAASGETVGELFIRKFGEEAYANLLGPLFGGLFGSDPREMYARHALAPVLRGLGVSRSILWRFVQGGFSRAESPAAVSFREGMEQLPRALFERHPERVRLNAPAHRVRKNGNGWTVETASGAYEVEHLVLTTPADVSARLLEDVAPEASQRLAALRYNRLALVHLFAYTPLDGLGYQVALSEKLRTRGVTWNAPALGRDGIYTAFLGGAKDPELPDLDDDVIGNLARSEFRQVTGHDSEWLGVSRTRMPAWDRSWMALDGLDLPAGLHLCANFESRVGIPGRVERARSVASLLRDEATRTV